MTKALSLTTRYAACVFDLDGTLIDSLSSLTLATNDTLATYGYAPLETTEVRSCIGYGARRLIGAALALRTTTGLTNDDLDEAYRRYRKAFARRCLDGVVAYPGMPALLADLSRAGAKLAVLTNKPECEAKACVEHVFPGLSLVVVGGRPDRPLKPDPCALTTLLTSLNVSLNEAVMVGDGDTDIAVGHKALVDTIAVGWGYRACDTLTALRPTRFVNDVKALREALLVTA